MRIKSFQFITAFHGVPNREAYKYENPRSDFQIDALKSASDWLIVQERLFDWLRAPPI